MDVTTCQVDGYGEDRLKHALSRSEGSGLRAKTRPTKVGTTYQDWCPPSRPPPRGVVKVVKMVKMVEMGAFAHSCSLH
jgi:hypothetical protein